MAAPQFPLRYSGKRWPSVKIAERFPSYEPPEDPTGDPKPVSWARLEVATKSEARETVIDGAAALWRTFAELDVTDDAEIISFVGRYGEPGGKLAPGVRVLTTDWTAHQAMFGAFADMWSPADENGISRIVGFAVDYDVADVALRTLKHVEVRVDRALGLVLHFSRLIDFMLASAMVQLLRRAPLRKCDRCHHWYEIQKTTSRTCSAACRVALSRERKEQE